VSFVGRAPPAYLAASDAARRLYSLQVQDTYIDPARRVHSTTINPGLAPITPGWRTLRLPGVRRGLHCGGHVGSAPVQSMATDRLGRYQPLFDPERSVAGRGALLFVGPQRFRFPPFIAELAARLRGRRPKPCVSRFARGYWVATDKSRLRTLQAALRFGCAVRDQTLLTTRASRPVAAKQTVLAGQIIAGDYQYS
jgi:hypothetical protein